MQTQILGEPTWADLGAEGILASNDQDEQVGVLLVVGPWRGWDGWICPSRQVGRGARLDMPARHDRPGQVNSGGCTPRYAPYTRRKYKPA